MWRSLGAGKPKKITANRTDTGRPKNSLELHFLKHGVSTEYTEKRIGK